MEIIKNFLMGAAILITLISVMTVYLFMYNYIPNLEVAANCVYIVGFVGFLTLIGWAVRKIL